jgi:hypothetical protein
MGRSPLPIRLHWTRLPSIPSFIAVPILLL